MAHSKQAQKRIRTNAKARQANKIVRSAARSSFKKAVATGSAEDQAKAQHALDKAAKKGVLHKNTAARRKSRLAKALNKQRAAGKK
jgi:small subunit ribosomal protein S20